MRPTLSLLALITASATAAHAAEDRYGPARAEPLRVAASGLDGGYGGRMLTWSSRAFSPQVPEAEAAPAAPRPPEPVALPLAPQRRATPVAAPVPAPAAAVAQPRTAAAAPALPDSIYAPPPPAQPQRVAQAAPGAGASGERVHLYSVHRQYGMTPDAITRPPASAANYVLIGPSEDADESKKSSDDHDRPF